MSTSKGFNLATGQGNIPFSPKNLAAVGDVRAGIWCAENQKMIDAAKKSAAIETNVADSSVGAPAPEDSF